MSCFSERSARAGEKAPYPLVIVSAAQSRVAKDILDGIAEACGLMSPNSGNAESCMGNEPLLPSQQNTTPFTHITWVITDRSKLSRELTWSHEFSSSVPLLQHPLFHTDGGRRSMTISSASGGIGQASLQVPQWVYIQGMFRRTAHRMRTLPSSSSSSSSSGYPMMSVAFVSENQAVRINKNEKTVWVRDKHFIPEPTTTAATQRVSLTSSVAQISLGALAAAANSSAASGYAHPSGAGGAQSQRSSVSPSATHQEDSAPFLLSVPYTTVIEHAQSASSDSQQADSVSADLSISDSQLFGGDGSWRVTDALSGEWLPLKDVDIRSFFRGMRSKHQASRIRIEARNLVFKVGNGTYSRSSSWVPSMSNVSTNAFRKSSIALESRPANMEFNPAATADADTRHVDPLGSTLPPQNPLIPTAATTTTNPTTTSTTATAVPSTARVVRATRAISPSVATRGRKQARNLSPRGTSPIHHRHQVSPTPRPPSDSASHAPTRHFGTALSPPHTGKSRVVNRCATPRSAQDAVTSIAEVFSGMHGPVTARARRSATPCSNTQHVDSRVDGKTGRAAEERRHPTAHTARTPRAVSLLPPMRTASAQRDHPPATARTGQRVQSPKPAVPLTARVPHETVRAQSCPRTEARDQSPAPGLQVREVVATTVIQSIRIPVLTVPFPTAPHAISRSSITQETEDTSPEKIAIAVEAAHRPRDVHTQGAISLSSLVPAGGTPRAHAVVRQEEQPRGTGVNGPVDGKAPQKIRLDPSHIETPRIRTPAEHGEEHVHAGGAAAHDSREHSARVPSLCSSVTRNGSVSYLSVSTPRAVVRSTSRRTLVARRTSSPAVHHPTPATRDWSTLTPPYASPKGAENANDPQLHHSTPMSVTPSDEFPARPLFKLRESEDTSTRRENDPDRLTPRKALKAKRRNHMQKAAHLARTVEEEPAKERGGAYLMDAHGNSVDLSRTTPDMGAASSPNYNDFLRTPVKRRSIVADVPANKTPSAHPEHALKESPNTPKRTPGALESSKQKSAARSPNTLDEANEPAAATPPTPIAAPRVSISAKEGISLIEKRSSIPSVSQGSRTQIRKSLPDSRGHIVSPTPYVTPTVAVRKGRVRSSNEGVRDVPVPLVVVVPKQAVPTAEPVHVKEVVEPSPEPDIKPPDTYDVSDVEVASPLIQPPRFSVRRLSRSSNGGSYGVVDSQASGRYNFRYSKDRIGGYDVDDCMSEAEDLPRATTYDEENSRYPFHESVSSMANTKVTQHTTDTPSISAFHQNLEASIGEGTGMDVGMGVKPEEIVSPTQAVAAAMDDEEKKQGVFLALTATEEIEEEEEKENLAVFKPIFEHAVDVGSSNRFPAYPVNETTGAPKERSDAMDGAKISMSATSASQQSLLYPTVKSMEARAMGGPTMLTSMSSESSGYMDRTVGNVETPANDFRFFHIMSDVRMSMRNTTNSEHDTCRTLTDVVESQISCTMAESSMRLESSATTNVKVVVVPESKPAHPKVEQAEAVASGAASPLNEAAEPQGCNNDGSTTEVMDVQQEEVNGCKESSDVASVSHLDSSEPENTSPKVTNLPVQEEKVNDSTSPPPPPPPTASFSFPTANDAPNEIVASRPKEENASDSPPPILLPKSSVPPPLPREATRKPAPVTASKSNSILLPNRRVSYPATHAANGQKPKASPWSVSSLYPWKSKSTNNGGKEGLDSAKQPLVVSPTTEAQRVGTLHSLANAN